MIVIIGFLLVFSDDGKQKKFQKQWNRLIDGQIVQENDKNLIRLFEVN